MDIEFIKELIKSTIKENLKVSIYTEGANVIGTNLIVELSFKGEESPFYKDVSYLTADYSEEDRMGEISRDIIIEVC